MSSERLNSGHTDARVCIGIDVDDARFVAVNPCFPVTCPFPPSVDYSAFAAIRQHLPDEPQCDGYLSLGKCVPTVLLSSQFSMRALKCDTGIGAASETSA